ncbi:7404_t:CDS:2 [Entrophospora sp. SA101]|nr:7404_t:CDS:2 [Entrophospora sp. SA101]
MDEQIQEIFDDQEIGNFHQENFYINPDETISRVFIDVQSETSDASTSSKESTVWKYFYKRPSFAPEHNVCKTSMCREDKVIEFSNMS